MTTIRQFIQTSPTTANELFAELVDTSASAVKTRERPLGKLREELELLANLEERRLFPVLRKHKEQGWPGLPPELARATIASLHALGSFQVSAAVKAALEDRIR